MDAPRIRYATTNDGHAIAYAVSGSGPPLISVPAPPDNHIGLEWDQPDRRAPIEAMGRFRSVVRFDGRGTGLSDREADDLSLAARVRDMEAVVQALGSPRFAVLTGGHGAQVAAAYAVAHPELVTHLVLVNPFVTGEEFLPPDILMMWRGILRTDFRMFTEALGAETFGWGKEEGTRFGEYFRNCVSAEMAGRIYDEMSAIDLTGTLPLVQTPTLIIRTQESGMSNPAAARRFAALIPGAKMAFAAGRPVEGATPEILTQAGEFLGEDWSAPAPAPAAAPRPRLREQSGLRIILFTDLEGHTEMMSRLGDAAGRGVLREHERITREALLEHGGSEVKTLGDGFLASFGSAQHALESAAQMQRAFAAWRPEGSPESGQQPLRVRIGINAGEPILEDDDLFGHSVIAAARVAAQAEGGEILVTNVVRELVAGKGFLLSDRGPLALKGLDEPVRVWQLKWD